MKKLSTAQRTQDKDFTVTLLVDQTPKQVFDAVTDVRGWWTENISGSSKNPGDEFSMRYEDIHYSKQQLVEAVPGKKVVWLVTESSLSFVKDKGEWTGTKVSFEISKQGNKTQLRFTHHGLVPAVECYDKCTPAWTYYVKDSLLSLITTGKGQPEPKEKMKQPKALSLEH